MNTTRSEGLFAAARRVIPGGVNSPARAYGSVGGTPRFIERGAGASFWDVDGNRYLDYVLSWGPLAVGHAHPAVVKAISQTASRGTSYGAPTATETELAELVVATFPAVDLVRLVNSGTEATMTAVRLARAFTGRTLILKFAGCYHGHADMFLVQAGSAVATLGLPDSPGVPAATTADTLVAPFNDLDNVASLFNDHADEIAAVIVEPVAGNMGVVPPRAGFLDGLQELCRSHGALFILDEVITGFRASPGGAQARWALEPDITCLGKVIGGGLPVGAYGGRRDVMETVAPVGAMYQAGTLSGNPLATSAGLATLHTLQEPGAFDRAESLASRLASGLQTAAESAGLRLQTAHIGTILGFYFINDDAPPDATIHDYDTAREYADTDRYARFFHALLERGVYFAPSQFEAGFLSTAHTPAMIDEVLHHAEDALRDAFGI